MTTLFQELQNHIWTSVHQVTASPHACAKPTSGVLARMVRLPEPLVQMPTASPAARRCDLMKGAACSNTYTRRCSVPFAQDLMTKS